VGIFENQVSCVYKNTTLLLCKNGFNKLPLPSLFWFTKKQNGGYNNENKLTRALLFFK
jgi:hypothetical protein